MRRGAMWFMQSPPTSENVRLTISVTPEVHAAFSRMAEVSGMSLGRCMGEWLGDTLEGVEFLTLQLQRAREAPRNVVRELRQTMLGLVDELDAIKPSLPAGRAGVTAAQRGAPARPATPPSNTGVTTTKTRTRKGGNDVQNAR